MAVYGLQADVSANPNQAVSLYVPGKTQLSSSDVFLGGPATGVTDAMLGPATRVYGNDRAGTTKALNNYNSAQASPIASAQAGATSNIYGLQADVNANPGKNVQLYTPGQTQLTAQDVFLGGPATGVSNADLNGATRLAGNDRTGTSQALANYNQDLSSQLRAAQAANAAPRVDANLGMPTLARQNMENGQAQNAVADNLAQNSFDQAKAQALFTNGITRGTLMGNYEGASTLAQKAQDIQNAQYNTTLASDNSNKAADRTIAQQNADVNQANVTGSSGTISGGGMPAAYSGWISGAAAQNGIDPAILAGLIQTESGFDPNAVNSSSGATGLGQFLPSTAKEQGLANSKDPQTSIYAAAKYLATRIKEAGSVNGGIMGYGEGTTAYLNKVLDASKSFSSSSGGEMTKKAPVATAAQINAANQASAFGDVDSAIASGASLDTINNNIIAHAADYPAGTSYSSVLAYAKAKFAQNTATQATADASGAWNAAQKNW